MEGIAVEHGGQIDMGSGVVWTGDPFSHFPREVQGSACQVASHFIEAQVPTRRKRCRLIRGPACMRKLRANGDFLDRGRPATPFRQQAVGSKVMGTGAEVIVVVVMVVVVVVVVVMKIVG